MVKPKLVKSSANEGKKQVTFLPGKQPEDFSEITHVESIGVMSETELISLIRNLEKRLIDQEKLMTELKLKNEQLLAVISEKDKFFTIIAHDLRNPLQAQKGFIQILYEEIDTLTKNEIKEITLHIKNSTNSFSDLLENLMLWARLQRGLTHFNQEVVYLLPVIKDSISGISEIATNKGIELTYNVTEDIKVLADVNIVNTIFRNLISNAVKFTPNGGSIFISARPSDNKTVEISIRDSGIGMSPSIVNDLFKFEPGTSRNGSGGEHGTGLGLIICKDFVENQSGRLWVESEEEKGSVFYFTLPEYD